jgi:hypothetical protein
MSAIGIIFSIFNWLASLAGLIGVIGLVPSIVAGVIFFIMASDAQQDVEKKRIYRKRGMIFIFLPFVLVISALVLLVISTAIKSILGIGLLK